MSLFSLDPAALPSGHGEAILPFADLKAHLRVDGMEDDALIEVLRDAGLDLVEKYCSMPLSPRTGLVWRAAPGCFQPGCSVRLGLHPLIAIESIESVDSSGATVVAEGSDFSFGPHDRLYPKPGKIWPDSSGGATIVFSAGIASASVPAGLVHAVRLMAANLYENREGLLDGSVTGEIPPGVIWHCARYRIPVL